MLNNHVVGLRSLRRRDDHRRALIGQLTVQSELISRVSDLSLANVNNIKLLSSRSTPVMMAARKNHVGLIGDLKRPWWKELKDETLCQIAPSSCLPDHEKHF